MISYRKEILEEVERRRLELNVALLKVYNYYRVLVGLGLLAVSSQTLAATRLGALDPTAFFLLAAGLSFLMSVSLYFTGSHEQGIFVGIPSTSPSSLVAFSIGGMSSSASVLLQSSLSDAFISACSSSLIFMRTLSELLDDFSDMMALS